ncbi:hypothetical protein ACNUDN_05960 [Mycobacterium sp. smrl_JER01]
MGNLAGFQRALDLYGAAVYWSCLGTETSSEPASLAAKLREHAAAAGASQDQLSDAEQYARNCVSRKQKPLMAGHSFHLFRNEASR